MDERLYEWKEIAADFQDNLIVGNGGAIAVDKDRFSYSSLYSFAKERDLLSASVQEVFTQMDKDNPDFERVLYQLWMADFVNSKLLSDYQKEKNPIRKSYTSVRRTLIKTIHEIHPGVVGTRDKLKCVGSFVKGFKKIFYLNYDLLLYWATLSFSQSSSHRFVDHFNFHISGDSESGYFLKGLDVGFFEDPHKNRRPNVTEIFYPHGSLLLYQTKEKRHERSIRLPDDSSLRSLTDFWAEGDKQPIFVCEGTSQDKLRSISESRYLTEIYQKTIPSIDDTLVIYGWSMGDQDKHILDRLADCKLNEIAISLYLSEKDDGIVHMREIRKKFKRISDANLTFFRADSPGCWCHE